MIYAMPGKKMLLVGSKKSGIRSWREGGSGERGRRKGAAFPNHVRKADECSLSVLNGTDWLGSRESYFQSSPLPPFCSAEERW